MICPVLVTFAEFALISPVSLVCRLSSTAFALMPAVAKFFNFSPSISQVTFKPCKTCEMFIIVVFKLAILLLTAATCALALSCAFMLIFICEVATF